MFVDALLRRQHVDVLVQVPAQAVPAHGDMPIEAVGLVLGQDEYIEVLPPQQRIDENWYKGTADAIYQNIYTIEKANPHYVLILAGDHIYKMDYSDMIRAHIDKGADLTVGCITVPRSEAHQFGVMQVDANERIVGFLEKPQRADRPFPAIRSTCLASMGIYVFTARPMYELLCQDATKPDSDHDFGKNIIPGIIEALKCSLSDSATRTARPCPTGATSARSTPITRRTWTWSTSTRC